MMLKKYNHQRGFTLVETLVYIGVMVVIASALVTTFLSLSVSLAKSKTDRELTESATLALERISRTLRSADSVDVLGSTFGVSPGILELTEGGTTTSFYVSGDRLVISVNGTERGSLTSSEVVVEDLTFTHYQGSMTELVRAAITLSIESDTASSTRTFYTSAVVRGSYE